MKSKDEIDYCLLQVSLMKDHPDYQSDRNKGWFRGMARALEWVLEDKPPT